MPVQVSIFFHTFFKVKVHPSRKHTQKWDCSYTSFTMYRTTTNILSSGNFQELRSDFCSFLKTLQFWVAHIWTQELYDCTGFKLTQTFFNLTLQPRLQHIKNTHCSGTLNNIYQPFPQYIVSAQKQQKLPICRPLTINNNFCQQNCSWRVMCLYRFQSSPNFSPAENTTK